MDPGRTPTLPRRAVGLFLRASQKPVEVMQQSRPGRATLRERLFGTSYRASFVLFPSDIDRS
jgi:hypothetical protein